MFLAPKYTLDIMCFKMCEVMLQLFLENFQSAPSYFFYNKFQLIIQYLIFHVVYEKIVWSNGCMYKTNVVSMFYICISRKFL